MEENNQNLQFTENLEKMKQFAKAIDNVLQLTDLTQNSTKTWTVFSKDRLRQYMQNPNSESSRQSLRDLSMFLYTISFPLRRIVNYFASLPDFSAYKINLDFSLTEDNDEEKLMKDYEDACRFVRKMNLEINIFKLLVIAWREGIVYFQPYQDADGNMLLMPLDSRYCKPAGIGYNNLIHVAFDFSFFRGTNEFYLDIWDKEFKQKYNKYSSDTSLRWQQLDNARAFKIDISDLDLLISPFASLFESIIDLVDLTALANVRSKLDVYKLLVMKIPMLKTETADDFGLSLTYAQKFYEAAKENLSEDVGLILSPMDVSAINFDKSATSDTNDIIKSYDALMENAGVGQIMSGSRLTGSTSVQMSMLTDAMLATDGLIQQIEAFVNERLRMEYNNTSAYLEFLDVNAYNKQEKISTYKDLAALGVPVKLELASLCGMDPLSVMASDWLENKLGLGTTAWCTPLVNGYTNSGVSDSKGGAPTKDKVTDDGEKSRDKRDATN